MKLWAGFFLGFLMLMSAAVSTRALPNGSQQASSAAKADQNASASAKDKIPLPQVPRITAEEVQRLIKEKGMSCLWTPTIPRVTATNISKARQHCVRSYGRSPRSGRDAFRASRKQVDRLLLQLPPRGG